jgi:hypothetical protein
MNELQRVVFNYEGTINKLLVDDKGGQPPPHTHTYTLLAAFPHLRWHFTGSWFF